MNESMLEEMADIFDRGIEKARMLGASNVKLSFSRGESISCNYRAGRLKSAKANHGMSYSINVVVDGRMGSAGGNHLKDFDRLLRRALEMAPHGSKVYFDSYPSPADYVELETYSKRTAGLTRNEMIDACRHISEALTAHDDGLFVEAGSSRSIGESLMMTSSGVRNTTRSTGWGLHGGAVRTSGTDIFHAGVGRGWKDLNDLWDPGYIVERTVRDLELASEIVACPSGHTKALLDPGVFETFLSPMISGIDGRSVAMGNSPLADRLGDQILDSSITMIDDPHRDFGTAVPMDGDGVPTRVHRIVDGGVLTMFLYDLDTAGMAGAKPTGHNGCQPYDIEILPGEQSHQEMLADIDEGIYIRGMLGFGQGNITNGDFSANLSPGYLIRDGKIVGRIKDTMIAGNLFDLLKTNVAVSSDYDRPGRVPWAVIDGLNVSSASA
ncbi:MAG: TldD/PmbA family protein [Planctomycetota bacterium]|jgi:PmbA protein